MSAPELIVNADDFGRSKGVNRGVVQAHEHGIVTSTSLMVRWPAAVEAAAYARERPALGVGLHVDLGEWAPRAGTWEPVYQVVSPEDETAVSREVKQQLDRFRELLGRDPTHLDSHQHLHRSEPLRGILSDIGDLLDVPVRETRGQVRYCGSFYGQDKTGTTWREWISTERLLELLTVLPAGVTEIGCHPGYEADFKSSYLLERELEVEVLCDPRVGAAVAELGIVLRAFERPGTR